MTEPRVCPKCEGEGGWYDVDGNWVECTKCDGEGVVEEEEDDA